MIEEDRMTELTKHVAVIAEADRIAAARDHQVPNLVCEMARAALNLPEGISIDVLVESDKEELLTVMRGVRDTLAERREARRAQFMNMTQNVPPIRSPHF